MKKTMIFLALAIVMAANLGCCGRCRNLFRRGSPCGGTALAAQPMLRGPIPLGSPFAAPQAIMPQTIVAQPNCYQQAVPMCEPCQSGGMPCESECMPCDSGYMGGSTGYVGEGDCGCQTAPGEYFGGYLEGSAPPAGAIQGGAVEGNVYPQGSGTYPGPVTN